jgi:hypothetical protein
MVSKRELGSAGLPPPIPRRVLTKLRRESISQPDGQNRVGALAALAARIAGGSGQLPGRAVFYACAVLRCTRMSLFAFSGIDTSQLCLRNDVDDARDQVSV